MTNNQQKVLKIVHDIPEGKVVTYGDISDCIYGNRNCGRAVGAIIRAEEGRNDQFPWWRVVMAGLHASVQGQSERLDAEGVKFCGDDLVSPSHWYNLSEPT